MGLERMLFLRPLGSIFLIQAMLLFSMIMINSRPSQSASNISDQFALLSFKASLSPDPLGALSSWNQTLHFCQWQGVTCGRRHSERVTSLYLDSLNLIGPISPYLSNLTFLRILHLSGNQLHGHIPPELGRLFRLQRLNLSLNSLEGEIPGSLTQCSRLQFISLRDNKLQGEIPANLSRCPYLQRLSLIKNQLTGVVPAELGSLSRLHTLYLRRNDLSGSIPPSLGNLSSLVILDLSENNLEGDIPVELGRLANLGAFDVTQTNLSGYVPSSIYNLSSLYFLGLGGNQLSGTLPSDLGYTLPNLKNLLVQETQFHGPIPTSLSNASRLQQLQLTKSSFSGPIPQNLGNLKDLYWVGLDYNQIEARGADEWQFIDSLTNCTGLEYLNIQGNNLEGELPSVVGNLSIQLLFLDMGKNRLSGNIPAGIANLVGLTSLSLGQNHFMGTIPETFGRLHNLSVLWLSGIGLSGQIPSSLGNITHLSRLYLDNNSFEGTIPTSFRNYQRLELLNLSYNKLTGAIPKEIGSLISLSRFLDLSYNYLSGSVPIEVGSLKNLQSLDVSENQLSGIIPNTIGGCQVLEYLYMKGNHLQGPIPQTLKKLNGIQVIDLSYNNLSGNIPEFLEGFHLQYLNLSFNNLEGAVPTKGVFGNLSAISVAGNNKLCGGNPNLGLPACSSGKHRHRSPELKVIIPIVGVCLCLILLLCLFAARYRICDPIRTAAPVISLKDQYIKVSYADLFKATDGFSPSNLVGVGSFSSVYKGIIEDDQRVVAVKVLNLQQRGASESFMAECKVLRNIRHRNLIKILSSCSGVDFNGNAFQALVFEFMPNGSLDKWLHPEVIEHDVSRNLNFIQRLNIAIDMASALVYLHRHGETPIVHSDLKPSNILLDSNMIAYVGDFGLARFLSNGTKISVHNSTSFIGLKGSIGYVAPEYGLSGQVSTQGDVYSYGILLLEMFTRKSPVDNMFQDGLNLHKYVKMAFPDRIIDITDPRQILQEEAEEQNDNIQSGRHQNERMHECLVSVMRIGLQCSEESQRQRINMGDVNKEMHAIRERFLGLGSRHDRLLPHE